MTDSQQSSDQSSAERTSEEQFVTPDVDIYETDEGLVLLADLPGVEEGGVEVTVDDGNLTIVGRPKSEIPSGAAEIHSEYRTQSYRRVFTISGDIDTAAIQGEVSQGVLRLVLPKSDRAKAKRIPIQGG